MFIDQYLFLDYDKHILSLLEENLQLSKQNNMLLLNLWSSKDESDVMQSFKLPICNLDSMNEMESKLIDKQSFKYLVSDIVVLLCSFFVVVVVSNKNVVNLDL